MEDVRRHSVKKWTTYINDAIKGAFVFIGVKVWNRISELYTQSELTWTFLGSVLTAVSLGLFVLVLLFLVAQFIIVVANRVTPDSPENHQDSQNQSRDALQRNDAIKDIIIIHTEDGKNEAYQFKNHLQSDLSPRDVTVDVLDEIGAGEGRLSIHDHIDVTYRYIFLYLTKDFTKDRVTSFNSESHMVASLETLSKKGRVVPVWPSEDIKKNGNFPQFIRTITQLQYYDFFCETSKEHYIKKVERLIINGRDKYLKD